MTDRQPIDFAALDRAPEKTVANLCRIDVSDMITTMQQHPPLFGYVAASYEQAKIAEEQAKDEVDRIKAQVFMDMANEDPSLPVNRLERLTVMHDKYQLALEHHRDLAARTGRLKALMNTMEHRRDMIVQIHSRQKKELVS